jgi:hypothetical protein
MMRELIVDSFAGGGGASLGIEMALGLRRRKLADVPLFTPVLEAAE